MANKATDALPLKATESNWRLFMVRKADPAFLAFQKKVFWRDHNTCQFCGFQSHLHMEVINKDNNYRNNQLDNLLSACPFCAQCFFLESVSKTDASGGFLIHLPNMSQAELNSACHVLFAKIVSGSIFANAANNYYRSLKLRAKLVESQLGEGLSNPSWFGRLLLDANADQQEKMQYCLNHTLRLLPDMQRFIPILQAWILEACESEKILC